MDALRRAAASLIVMLVAACRPDLGPPDSLVTGARLLAVRGNPPEATPGKAVAYDVLAVDVNGTILSPAVAWAYCTAPKPLGENDVVARGCVEDAVAPFGGAAPIPDDACAIYGPDPPPGDYRPRDPDSSGGYYQPVRAEIGGAIAFGLERVTCNLANAPADVAHDFATRYHANANPKIATVSAAVAGAPVAFDAVRAGAHVVMSVTWTDADAERYVAFDAASQSLVDRREAMRVSWFASAGSFDEERTGRAEDDLATSSDNTWTAPSTPGSAHAWVVLRDSRGGVDFVPLDIVIVQ
jgi:hypothetical protein